MRRCVGMRRWVLPAFLALSAAACREGSTATRPLPASLTVVEAPAQSVVVGSSAGAIRVRVDDAAGAPLSGVVVTFTLSAGGGALSRTLDTTGTDGIATTSFTARTTPGANTITASVLGLTPLDVPVATVAGTTARLALANRSVRLPAGRDVGFIAVTAVDAFGNPTGSPVTWLARDPTLLSTVTAQNNTVTMNVLRRPGQTWVMAAADAVADSALVSVPDASAPCAFADAPTSLALGAAATFDAGTTCIHAIAAGSEYALIVHYGTAVTTTSVTVDVTGNGITAPVEAFPGIWGTADDAIPGSSSAFENALRDRERLEMPSRADAARAWYANRPPALSAQVREGDRLQLNVNARDFCSNPDVRGARVAAITGSAVVLADTANPDGGFSDAEYREFGMALDTLVIPVDTSAFGSPTDIDGNRRVGILFTRAVNELTPQGSQGGVVLGFYYARDLLPRLSRDGDCPGSNVAELLYVIVPDPAGVVNGNVRSKPFVQSVATATIGHEYQHLINASRRLYLNQTARLNEETWLNEGLSHVAEELLFYRTSGRSPRQNLDGAALAAGSQTRAMFDVYQRNNVARYREYLRAPESTSPLALDDRLATRGAIWSFLRYLADRTRATDGDFWRRLVNSQTSGVLNLDEVLAGTGVTSVTALRDWSVSVLADETAAGTSALSQPSWNFVTTMPAIGLTFALTPRILADGVTSGVVVQSGGSAYFRFAVPDGRDAFLQVTGFNGVRLPVGSRLTVVRIR